MDGKSKLPTMIKKSSSTVVRAYVPSDRLVSNATNKTIVVSGFTKPQAGNHRSALTSFESVLNSLRNGTDTGKRPTKRHASPEFRAPKPPSIIAAKKLRRSRSVSDIDTLNLAIRDKKRAANKFNLPLALAPKLTALKMPTKMPTIRVPLAPPKVHSTAGAVKPKPTVAVTSAASKPIAGHKKLVLNSKTTTKKENDAAKKVNDDGKPKTAGAAIKRIPAYDFKARFQDLSEKYKVLKEKHEEIKEQLGESETLFERYEECRDRLTNLQTDYEQVQVELATIKLQSAADQQSIKSLSDDLNAKINELRIVTDAKNRITEQYTVVNAENVQLKTTNSNMETQLNSQTKMIEQLQMELLEAGEQLFRANIERKELHNTIMDLRGNIRVFCRIRPPLSGEENRTLCSWQHNDETSLEIASIEVNKKSVKHDFTFDQVFRPNSMQQDIFELVSPLIQSALDGYNVCIFAYGQTGSGKTFTMDGTESTPGIIPRTIDLLFDCFKQNKRLGWEYSLRASSLEIYNEILFDLLSNEAKDLDIRMVSAKTPTEIFVQNLTECDVRNQEELHKLIEFAKNNRATAATVGNERSSRSHSVTQLRLFGEHKEKNEMTVSTINLIDLAGSESPKTSIRMEETKKINKSLSELTNVIMALLQKQDHIPYRNSKLTHLLMPSLGGNSKTLMFVNASPFQDCFVETVKSLRFAASVNSCKMNKAKKNKLYPSPLSQLNGTN